MMNFYSLVYRLGILIWAVMESDSSIFKTSLWGSVREKSWRTPSIQVQIMNVLTLSGACETNYVSWSAHSFWDGAACFYDCQCTHKQKRTSLLIKDFQYTIYSPECKMHQNNVDRQSNLNSLLIRGHKTWTFC